ncbi:hypothetical protein [Tessaracoccus sp.]
MASTITISVLRCAVCRKLEDTDEPAEVSRGGVSITHLTRYARVDNRAQAWEDLWICSGCVGGKSLGNLLEIISRAQEPARLSPIGGVL